ncbi:MAG TPA: ABC transporter permease [Cyclobacteriaceae bacterium]|nr:ABC transporter permease [Cyclobacteriaceae bacterium]
MQPNQNIKSKPNTEPPRLATTLLQQLIRDELQEEIIGDLKEKFQIALEHKSVTGAKLHYWYQTLNYLRPFAIRKRSLHTTTTGMLNNNLKIGWRQMSRQKMYSAIKIGGFSLGIAASLLITLYIIDDLSFDSQPKHANRIFRIYQKYQAPEQLYQWTWFQAPFAKTVKQMFPEVELIGRYNESELFGVGNAQIRRIDQPDNSYEEGITYFDQELIELLELPLIYGDSKTCLDERNEMVITRKKAEKYFPGEDPTGKLMIYNNETDTPIKIGGVIEDFPPNSTLQYDFLVSLANREMWEGESDNWNATNYPTYVRLREGADPNEFAVKLKKIAEIYLMKRESNPEDWFKNTSYGLQPLRDIHLKSADISDPVYNHGDIRFVWMFGAVAGFILLIACVNFINLSTAKSASRAKEVGLRKTVGSFRSHIIRQFLVESLIFSVMSFVIGVLLAWIVLPYFNDLAGKSIIFPWSQLWFAPCMIAASILVGFFAGIYPSFYLSSFKPAEVLKGSFARSNKNALTRSSLVVFQFTTSVVLIISTVVIYRQMNHILNAKLGYDKDQVLVIRGTNTLGKEVYPLKEELLNLASVKSATIGDYLPVRGAKRNGNYFKLQGEESKENRGASGQFWRVDPDYADVMGMKMIDGRFFDRKMASDSDAVVINQAMAKELGLDKPLGQKIFNYRNWNIIGVVENFYFDNIREKIGGLAMVIKDPSTGNVSIKLSTNDLPGTMRSIEEIWKKFSPHQPLRTMFVDETFASTYDDVKRMGQIFTSFSTLAIIVACLGLFALSAFMVEQRGKEISIRLVLGASVRSIFGLLTANFVKLVLISIALAAPLAWYIMDKWLQGFDYKTTIGWDVFAIAGSMAVLIALGTISYQAVRAGLVKPVNGLKSE